MEFKDEMLAATISLCAWCIFLDCTIHTPHFAIPKFDSSMATTIEQDSENKTCQRTINLSAKLALDKARPAHR